MTSEKELRQIAVEFIRDSLDGLADEAGVERPDDFSALDDHDLDRVCALIRDWPIPDLPPADRHGYWWPKHGRNYGNVHGHIPLDSNGELRHGEWEVVIGRGSGYIHLTPDEAEELASLLLAAAHHERNQE